MHGDKPSSQRTWTEKFRDAFRGLKEGVRGQSSFFVHFFAAAAVIAFAAILRVDRTEWCLLALCITLVLAAELFNSALESLARAVTNQMDPRVGAALDIGSAAVLITSLGAVIVGTVVFLNRLAALVGWW